jgi:hypothetical protein
VNSIDGRKTIDDSGRDEQLAREEAPAAGENDPEAFARPTSIFHLARHEFDSVPRELPAADREKLHRGDTVTRQETVQRPGGGVARASGVAEQNPAPAPSQDESGRQPRGSSPDDDRVVHGRARRIGQCGVGEGVGREEEK